MSTCAFALRSRSAATSSTTARSSVLRLGNRWDLVFHQSLKRDAKGKVTEFDIDPRLMEQFAAEASAAIRKRMDEQRLFALVTTAETRPLCADDHRAHVPDARYSLPARGRARFRSEVARDHLVIRYSGDSGGVARSRCHPRESGGPEMTRADGRTGVRAALDPRVLGGDSVGTDRPWTGRERLPHSEAA